MEEKIGYMVWTEKLKNNINTMWQMKLVNRINGIKVIVGFEFLTSFSVWFWFSFHFCACSPL